MSINEFRAIATFTKAVELGSIRKAAIAQGVSPQAASQGIAQLEKHLGVRLLHRTTRSLALTDEGQHFLESTQPALAALERALNRAKESQDEIAGPLRIVGPQSSFAHILTPLLVEFCAQYPDIQPDVQLSDGLGNWVLERADVGFRIGASPEEGVIARRLVPVQLIICAAPSYLERHGMPQGLDELSKHRCSVFRHPTTGQVLPWYVNMGGEIVHRQVPPALFTNNTELELEAVLGGQVLGQLANLSAAPHIRAGRLVPVLLPHLCDHFGLHVYYGSRRALPRRVRAFIDLAISRLLDTSDIVLSARELAAAQDARRGKRKRP